MRILLLNPPGDKLYIRSNYCSKVSKSLFVHEPVDLVMMSGRAAEVGETRVIDCIAERLDYKESIARVKRFNPDYLISLIGSASWSNDLAFLRKMKEAHPVTLLISGDQAMEEPLRILQEHSFLDAVVLDYTSPDVARYVKGERSSLRGIACRQQDVSAEPYLKKSGEEFALPIPRHELFPLKKYRFPFVRSLPVASVLTDFGCPYGCSFCIFGSLGYKVRSIDNVMLELTYLVTLGVREVVFGDQTFAAQRLRTVGLCRSILHQKLRLGWSCYSRVDVVDEELLVLCKRAGCHTIIFGVESGNDATLRRYHKGLTTEHMREVFHLCRLLRIQTVATFIIGLPSEGEEECARTIQFAKELECDFASFNTPVPRMRTLLRREAMQQGWVSEEMTDTDQSGMDAYLTTPQLSATRLKVLRARAEREFYLRPSYLCRRLFAARSLWQLRLEIEEGLGLLSRVRMRA